jgi:hypothetical protein
MRVMKSSGCRREFEVGDIMQDRIIKTFLILSSLSIIAFKLIMTSLSKILIKNRVG